MTTKAQRRRTHVRTVVEVHEVADMADLRQWASAHGAKVRYLGPTRDHQELYGARRGPQIRVCRTEWEGARRHPFSWKSPLEHLPPAT
ncbi:hypothetical protein [Nocardiopsis sp. YSL2]|uniref:hypothetical protein n=1 Tax=Nocardiopsis sp. YSL2 TaxID=2939492 RepID=UPI0026F419EE|nr:hypothetical protein [Nocardiopsis sp. YSL2]